MSALSSADENDQGRDTVRALKRKKKKKNASKGKTRLDPLMYPPYQIIPGWFGNRWSPSGFDF